MGLSHFDNYDLSQDRSQTFDQEELEAFASLFKGRTDCWGKISTQTGQCIYETVTLEHYRRHLKGEINLGIYFNLNDSTCHFAAIDLDEKDFNKAKAIRDELTNNSIPAYIATSKSKGFHIYLFAFEEFKAVEIRRVLKHTLNKLNIKAEVFPKQDYHQPDNPPSKKYSNGEKHPGSYINLPSFGYTRPFLSDDFKEVPLKVALEQIKFIPQEAINRVLEKLPKGKAKVPPQKKAEHYDDKVAVEKLLESCSFMQHCRDDAATLPEPEWFSMCNILSFFDELGKKKAHKLSQPYPKYTWEETNKKLEYAKEAKDKDIGPHTCAHIEKDLGFVCPADCLAKKEGVKSPAGLATKLARTAGLPVIVVTNRFLREKTADTIAAVERANQPPRLFERSGSIARIAHDEFGVPYIEVVTENACRGFIERAAAYIKVDNTGKEIPASAPPLDVVRDFMSLPHRNLPALLNITEVPILRGDGSVLTEQGYDQASRLYYEPAAGLMMPAVQNSPSKTELGAAIALIQEPLLDFPFDSEASKTNALAVLLTPVCRPMIAGLTPLCLLDKPQPGTGAGLLSDVIAVIATGRQAAMMAPPRTDEECEKRLASILLHGQAIIIIDNVAGYLYFASLAMLLTTTIYQTRILGQTKTVCLPNRGTYIVTGNNIKLGGDMARRCYLSRMDAHEARPWMRDRRSFKYQNLIQWVKENRGRLLAAILTMARAWVAAGKPLPEGLPPLGGYEDWVNTIGGVLAHAGFTDFLGNLEFMYQQADVETPQWEGFLAAWQEEFGEDPTTVDTIVKGLNENDIMSGALPDRIDRNPEKINRSLANALRHRAGVRYPNGLMVTKCDYKVHHAVPWQVVNYREESEKRGVRGVSDKNLVRHELGTQGELGESGSYLDSQLIKKEKEGEDKEYMAYGLDHNSPNSLLATGQIQKPNSPFSNDLGDDMPDYPHEKCPTCGGDDFWPLTKEKRWLCSRCHPEPKEIDREV